MLRHSKQQVENVNDPQKFECTFQKKPENAHEQIAYHGPHAGEAAPMPKEDTGEHGAANGNDVC